MRYFRFEGPDTSDWGWKENPIDGGVYSMDRIKEMYGPADYDVEPIISAWEDEEWNWTHGKWIEVDENGKEL